MAASFVVYDADGVSGDYAIPFDYFSVNHLEARVNNTIVGFTVLNPQLIRIAPTPTAGVKVSISRRTPANLVVPAALFPRLVRTYAEESQDTVFNFDAIYGEVFYDIILSASNGVTEVGTLGAINPNLTLRSLASGSSATLNNPAEAPVELSVDAISVGNVVTPVASISFAANTQRGVVTVAAPNTVYPSGTIFRVMQVSAGAYTGANLLLRFGRV